MRLLPAPPCAGMDPEVFFPVLSDYVPQEAAAACAVCPHGASCLAEALRTRSVGVWAGTSAKDRERGRDEQARPGEKWCGTCQKSLPVDAFGRNRARPDGLHTQCRRCHADQQRRSYRQTACGAVPASTGEQQR